MMFSILSHFNHRYGPKIFLSVPELPESLNLDHIPCLMDLYKEGFFIHEFQGTKSANLIFNIYNRFARGRREMLMLTIVSLEKDYRLNLASFQPIMEFFVNSFKKIEDLHLGLDPQEFPEAGKYNEIMDFMESFSNSLPDQRAIYKQALSKILTYGLSPIGTDRIIQNLEQKILRLKRVGVIQDQDFF